MKRRGVIDPWPYQIHEVLDDAIYRLSRDGHLQGRVYPEENLLSAPEYNAKYESIVYESSEYPKANEHVPNTAEGVTKLAGSSTKPIKQEASESGPSIAYKMTGWLSGIGANAQDDQLIRQQTRGQAKTQKLRSMLSWFGLGERSLADGKRRVRWRCVCGRNLYDDFTELRPGAAAEVEKWLNDSMRKHTGSSASNSQQSTTLTSAVSSNAGSSGSQHTAASDVSLQSQGPSVNFLPASNTNTAIAIDFQLVDCWLILCGNLKRGPDVLLTQMNLSSTPSDKSFFEDMKRVYSNFKQSWTIRSFLRGVETFRFVQESPYI